MLDRHDAHHGPSCHEHRVEPGSGAPGEPWPAGGQEVGLADEVAQPCGPSQRGRQRARSHHRGGPTAFATDGVPAVVGVVMQDDGHRVVVEQVAQLAAGDVEHLVEVERRRERLGDLVELVQEGVGIGETPDPVHRGALALLRLPGDAPGVAGHEGHQEDLHRPLEGDSGVVCREERFEGPRDADREDRHGGDPEAEAEPAGKAGDRDGGEQREGERGVPVPGAGEGEHGRRDLAQNKEQAGGVVAVAEWSTGAVQRVGEEHRRRDGEPNVSVSYARAGQHQRHGCGAPPYGEDRLRKGAERVAGVGCRRARGQPNAPPMSEAAGPSSTTKIAGKMQSTSGNRIFTGSLAAFSRAHC